MRWVPYWKGFVCWIEIFWFSGFGRCFKNPMFLSEKSLISYVGLYLKFLHKIFIITAPSPPPTPQHSSHTSPNGTTLESGTRSTVFRAHQEASTVRGCQCTFTKCFAEMTTWLPFFLGSRVICLGKSMPIWHSTWKCSGCIFCPCNPHPSGNEWHTAWCALSGILFVVDFVEGKAHPHQDGPLEFEDLSVKTVGLLLRMMKIYLATGRYLILDYGFCVLKGFIQLRKKGFFACYFTKKRI